MANGLFEQSLRLRLRFEAIELVRVSWGGRRRDFVRANRKKIGEAIPGGVSAPDASHQDREQDSIATANPGPKRTGFAERGADGAAWVKSEPGPRVP